MQSPTTYEMDGLLTEEDIKNKDKVVYQCKSCKKWTTMNHPEPMKTEWIPCSNCGETNYDQSSIKSLRTYNPLMDNKRKPK